MDLGDTGQQAQVPTKHRDASDGIDLYFSTFVKHGQYRRIHQRTKSGDQIPPLTYRSREHCESLPLIIVEGMLKRMEMVKTMPELREKLWNNVLKIQQGLKDRGFDIGHTNSPVTPIYMKGDVPEATQMVMDLRENYHIFCSIVVYPVIPKGDIIYRIHPTVAHGDEDIELTLKAFEETRKYLMPALTKRPRSRIWRKRSDQKQNNLRKGHKALFSCTLVR